MKKWSSKGNRIRSCKCHPVILQSFTEIECFRSYFFDQRLFINSPKLDTLEYIFLARFKVRRLKIQKCGGKEYQKKSAMVPFGRQINFNCLLDIWSNHLEHLDNGSALGIYTHLETFHIEGNQLESIPKIIQHLPKASNLQNLSDKSWE